MLPFKTQGEENSVHWIVEPHGNKYIIAVYNEKKKEFKTNIYICKFAPICGLDIADTNGIESLLDSMIKEVL